MFIAYFFFGFEINEKLPVHTNFVGRDGIIWKDDTYGFLSFFALEQNWVSSEKFQFVHFGLRQSHNGVVIISSLIDNQTVWPFFFLQNCYGQIVGSEKLEEMGILKLYFWKIWICNK